MAELPLPPSHVLRSYREAGCEIRPFANPGEMDRRAAEEDANDQTGLFVIALVVVSFIGLCVGFIAGIAVGGGLS